MSDPVNLNRFRKAKAKAAKREKADENAIVHGLTKSQKDLAKKKKAQAAEKLDGKKRDPD